MPPLPRDPYSLLGVSPDASEEEIRNAYLRITRLVHPDRFDPEVQPREWKDANEFLKAINAAYALLRDREAREAYDRARATLGQSQARSSQGRTGERSDRYEEGRERASPLRTGHARFADLPLEVRHRLHERQRDEIEQQAWAATATITGAYAWAALLSLWFGALLMLAAYEKWAATTIVWMGVATLAVGVLVGRSLNRIIGWHASPLRPRLYVTPSHLIDVELDEVRWWPIRSVASLDWTHRSRNGHYQDTLLVFELESGSVDFSVSPRKPAEKLVQAFRTFDRAARTAASEGRGGECSENDEFRGLGVVAPSALGVGRRYEGHVAGIALALISFAAALAVNQSSPRFSGPPPASVGVLEVPPASAAEVPTPTSAAVAQSPTPVPTLVFVEPPKPLPKNGHVKRFHSGQGQAKFEVRTPAGEGHYYVKLVDAYSEKPVLALFVRAGETASVKVPLGTMKVRWANGETWYGDRYLFGEETTYAEANDTFNFEIVANRITGWTVELIKQEHGNLTDRRIRPEQW